MINTKYTNEFECISQYYIQILKNIIRDKVWKSNYKFTKSEKTFEHLVPGLKIANRDKYDSSNTPAIQVLDKNIDTSKFPRPVLESLNNIFIPISITEWILTQVNTHNTYSYTSPYETLNINILSSNSSSVTLEFLDDVLCVIFWIKKLYEDFPTSSQTLNLHIFLCDESKELKGKVVNRSHVNSGTSCTECNWIQVFRTEDLFKVLIHEIIHYYSYDFGTVQFSTKVKLNNKSIPVLVNEAYVECIALYFYEIFYSVKFNKVFLEVLEQDLYFSRIQLCKMYKGLSTQKYSDLLDFRDVIQRTNAYSYYVLRFVFQIYSSWIVLNICNLSTQESVLKFIISKMDEIKVMGVNTDDLKIKTSKFDYFLR